MVTKSLAHGMGAIFIDCVQTVQVIEVPCLYKIRYRSATGTHMEESGEGAKTEPALRAWKAGRGAGGRSGPPSPAIPRVGRHRPSDEGVCLA